ncbi:DNA mismatch repair endonuclease MutL [Alloiococcus sp. CFN-8]|uniref:DNA mismatch repair endonuclease MutL n=1 Tax=Alloiococcus sp. CFN-8 TaxID=3416081 RepID=UPI003CFB580F
MKRINLLDEVISNKIAAGEVVERPASVVKELVENSIDAGALHINIEIEEGGETLIRITDDGVGIHPEDIEKAFLPHATSKIQDIEDLFKIGTLGFRGEALASIASIAKVKLYSKTEEDVGGKAIEYQGGIKDSLVDYPMNKGTIIEVRDIFYNVPARKKFLKSTSRESALIGDIINRIALANPDIAFTYINNNKKQFSTFGSGNTMDVIRNIYGKKIQENLIAFESHGDELSVYGYVGNSEISRGSRNNQSIYVNKRYIKSKLITAAVENAFKSFATINKFPFFVVFIDIYPELIDVNVHPTKAEIKFKDERVLFKIVFDTVHQAIKNSIKESFILPEELTLDLGEKVEPVRFNYEDIQISREIKEKNDNEYFSTENSRERSIERSIEQVEVNKNESLPDKHIYVDIPVDLKSPETVHEVIIKKNEHSEEVERKTSSIDNRKSGNLDFSSIRIIGQFDKTYILGEHNKILFLIDQHAAHEKVMFEKYIKEIRGHRVVVQTMLVPIVIELDIDDYSYYKENSQVFRDAGFLVEEFGSDTVVIKEAPYVIGRSKCKDIFLSILDNLKNMGSGKTEEYKYDAIARMACRSAVKAQEELTVEEMKELLKDLARLDEPFHCPHGRPTILKLSLYEMEKLFKRIQ